MSDRIPLAPLLLTAMLVGCGGDETEAPPPGNAASDCEAPEVALPDGTCIRPGVPPEGCAEGFIHDGEYGCEPILPAEPCPPGLMAVPGETECRAIMACGDGTWGDLPIDGTTQHVDGAYAGGNSDGSAAAPWTTIGEALNAAAPGALVAVAAGSYAQNISIEDKPVRLWGRCPELVELVGSGNAPAAIAIRGDAEGSEVGGLAIRGGTPGIWLSGSQDLRLERLWVHDTASRGINAESAYGPTSVTIVGSLVEGSQYAGVTLAGVEALVEGTVVRGTLPGVTAPTGGFGVVAQIQCGYMGCDPTARTSATVRRAVIEQSHEEGVLVLGSDALVEGTVVRGTQPNPANGTNGHGIAVQIACHVASCYPTARGNATIRGSLVEHNHELGLFVFGSDALVEHTVVRDTWPRPSDQTFGRAVHIQECHAPSGCAATTGSTATVRGSLLERSHEIALVVSASDALVEATVVRDTVPQPVALAGGRGIHVQLSNLGASFDAAARASAAVVGSLVERSHDVSLFAVGSEIVVDRTVVRSTSPRAFDGFFGDGVVVISDTAPAQGAITNSVIGDSTRAGLANFGAAVSLRSTHLQCAGYELEGEPFDGLDFHFDDQGGNGCGCPEAKGTCVVESAGLEPPAPAAPTQ